MSKDTGLRILSLNVNGLRVVDRGVPKKNVNFFVAKETACGRVFSPGDPFCVSR